MSFETEAIDLYRGLRERLMESKSCDESLEASLCHLLEEEVTHQRILAEAAAGNLTQIDLDAMASGHMYPGFDSIRPLAGKALEEWSADLSAALEQEEKTWIFYSNLRRMSKIPVVKKAFETLASMEKEHVDILRRILGRG
jgi:rubrerythrin